MSAMYGIGVKKGILAALENLAAGPEHIPTMQAMRPIGGPLVLLQGLQDY